MNSTSNLFSLISLSSPHKLKPSCTHNTTQQNSLTKKKRKPRPSFVEQVQEKWSRKLGSTRENFPWQEQTKNEVIVVSNVNQESEVKSKSFGGSKPEIGFVGRGVSAPWSHGGRKGSLGNVENLDGNVRNLDINVGNLDGKDTKMDILSSRGTDRFDSENVSRKWERGEGVGKLEEKFEDGESDAVLIGMLRDNGVGSNGLVEFPFRISEALSGEEGDGEKRRSNTMMAEKTIPAHELQRLRSVSLRMVERIKVGSTGVTEALVNMIHERWKVDEVVKLKFEEPLSLNMRRAHSTLESRTGGLVILRSGSLIVLYRGLSYKLPCVQAFAEQVKGDINIKEQATSALSDANLATGGRNLFRITEPSGPDSTKYLQNLSKKELMQLTELNQILDELGPRFTDWTGREPLPVDADLLPSVVRGYKPPIRLLPYRVRPCLSNTQMTKIRQLARTMPPHFALGRSRELQGLAKAMVKLWEKNTIAKIAIKRGVVNTSNERMAEELKRLTGGTVVSRNKDFIVFYRGNDFLPHNVTEAVKERQTLADFQQDQEDRARQMAASLIESTKARGSSTIAGTLAETTAAKSRWGHHPNSEEIQNLMRDSALTKQESLVRYFENKLALAKGKLMKAEKALARVQADLEPAELPTDSETLADEERFLFRKIGLSMKPYLLLGRRGVYDGTIENMHLHWKHRELVKIIVRGKTFAQVKHFAISLEAESGGVLVSLDKTTKGYAVIVYRGKNYQQPIKLRPKNLLSRREALARSIELQRREALKHHLSKLQGKIEQLKSELEDMKSGESDKGKSYSNLDVSSFSDNEDVEDEGEEAYLEVYDSSNEDE